MNSLHRRHFLEVMGASAGLAFLGAGCGSTPHRSIARRLKPIQGSWISVWWDDDRHHYWNEPCRNFTANQWRQSIQDMAELGFDTLVLLAIAKGGKAFYDTPLLPKLSMACPDPIEAMLQAGDRHGIRFFISSDWYGDWDAKALLDPVCRAKRLQMMGEVATRYGRHPSFYGWYWPNEAALTPYFTEPFTRHINECSAEGRRLLPKAKTLLAPYGTHKAVCDDTYVRQLEQLDVDIIAYQDEVGCLRMGPPESATAFERLRRAHDRVPQRALWADIEVFAWEGPPNRQTSYLIPAPFPRVAAQLAAVSPYVDKVLVYQYQGLMNRPATAAFAGHPDSTTLYRDYRDWLRRRGR